MISSATALIYFKSCGKPIVVYGPDGTRRAAWGMTDNAAMRWFGSHGFRVEWSKGTAAITEGRGALQRYVQTWLEIGAMERVEIVDENYNLTHGLIWPDIKGWEKAKVKQLQASIEEETSR